MALNFNDSFNPNDLSWMDGGSDPSERHAISKAMRFIFKAGKGFASGTLEGEYEKLAEKNFKNIDDANKEISDITSAASDALSEFGKTFGEFKSAAKQLGLSYTEGLSSVLPGGVYRRLSRAFEEPEDTTRSASDEFESKLQSDMASVFSAQSRISTMQHSASMKSAAADRTLNAKYHQQNVGLMAASNRSVAHIDAFLSTTYTNYLKKDLELKYRSYRIMGQLKSQMSTISEAFGKDGMITGMANALIPNPDADRGTRKINTAADFSKNIYKSIFENLLQIPSNLLQTGATIMSTLAQSPIEGIQGVAGLAGKWGGNKLLKHIKENYLSKKNQKRVDKWKGVLDDVMAAMSSDWEYFARNKSGVLNSLGQTLRGSDSSVLRFLGDAIPEFGRDNRVENKVVNDPKGAAVFDNITRETIISVIPTHLSRIGDQLEAFAKSQGITPDKTTTKVYDFRTRNLVTKEERRRRNVDAIYGKTEDRQERYYSTINTFMNLSQYIDDNNQQVEALSSIEENKQGLHLFIMRSARANLLVNETALLKVAKGTMLTGSEEDYVKATLGSISSAEAKNTARAILLLITRRDAHGKPHGVDHNLKRLINNKISEMSRDVDQNDMTRTQLEDLNMFDEEDYTYDEISGESNVNERTRTTQWSKDYIGTNEMGFNAGTVDETIVKDRARYQKWLNKIKDKHSRGTAAKWARRLNSNFAVFMGGKFLDEVDDWAQLAEEGLNDLGESVGSSKIMGWLNKKAGGKKNKVTRIVAYRDPKDTKPEDDVKAHVIFRVGGLTASSKYRSSFSFMLDDLKYTVGDVVMARMASDTQPSRELKPIVDEIINKLGRDKYEPEYSAEFFRYSTGEDESALDYDVEPPSGPGPAKAGGPGSQPPPGGGGFSQMWKNLADRTRSRISDFMTNSNLEGASGTKNYLDKIDRHSAQEYLASIDRNLVYLAKHFLPPEDSRSITSVLGRIAKADKIKRAAAEAEALRKASAEGSADRASKYQQVRMEDLKKRAKELVQRINSGTSSPMQQKIDQEALNNILSEFRLRGLRGAELEKYIPQRLTSSGKAFIMKEETDRYSNDPMSDTELKSARKWFEAKTASAEENNNPELAKRLAEQTIEFENAVKAGDWLTARQLSDQQYGQLQNYQYTTAMTKKEINRGTSVFSKRVEDKYNEALTENQIARLRGHYQKEADKGKPGAIDRLVAFNKLVADKDWKTLRTRHHLNNELVNYDKYKTAVEEERWEDARRMSGVLATKQSNDIGLYEKILTKWSATKEKNGELVKAYPFDEEHNSYISITLNNALAMLRNIEPGHKEVTTALTRILEAFGDGRTSVKNRTKKMLEVLDSIATDKKLYQLRHGEAYIDKIAEYDSGISVDDEALADKIQSETPTTKNPLFKEIKEQYEAYKKAGIDIPEVGTILNNLEGIKSSKEVNDVLRKIRNVYIGLGETDVEITTPYTKEGKPITEKIKFGEYMEKLDNVKVIIDENAFGKQAAARLYPEMLSKATGHVTGFMNKAEGKQQSKQSILEKLKVDTQKFADQKAAEAAKKAEEEKKTEEQGKQGIIDNIFGFFRRNKKTGETPKEGEDTATTSSSYADGSYGIAQLFSRENKQKKKQRQQRQQRKNQLHANFGPTGYSEIEVTPLMPVPEMATGSQVAGGLLGSFFGTIGGLLKNETKSSVTNNAETVLRKATKAGVSKDTASILSFMSMIANKLDQSIMTTAANLPDDVDETIWDKFDNKIKNSTLQFRRDMKAARIRTWRKIKRSAFVRNMKGRLVAGWHRAGDLARAGWGYARDAAIYGWDALSGGASKAWKFVAPRAQALGKIGKYGLKSVMPKAFGSVGGALGSLGLGALGAGMGALGSASSGAGLASQIFSGATGGLAGALALSNPVSAAILAAAMGANAMREGWNDTKTLGKSWGAEHTANDYQKGSTALGNIANYLSLGMLNKYGGRKYVDKAMQYNNLSHFVGGIGGYLGGAGQMLKAAFGSENSAMSDLELKRARAKLSIDIKRGAPDGPKRLEDFETAVAEKNWYRAREISGIHFEASKMYLQGLKRNLKGALAIGTLGVSSMIEMGYDKLIGNQNSPLTEDEIKRAYKNFAIREKKDPSVKELRLNFEEAVAGERWAIARKIAKMEDQGLLAKKFGKGWGTAAGVTGGLALVNPAIAAVAAGILLFGNNENEPMSEKEIKNFEEKCQKLINQGNTRAQDLLDKFEDAVANGKWALARKLSNKQTESLFMKGVKSAYTTFRLFNPTGWLFTDQSRPMTETDIINFRKKMEYMISKGDQLAKQKLDKFDIAVMNEDWRTARKISNMPNTSVGFKILKTAGSVVSWLFYADQNKPMTEEEIQKFRSSMQRKIEQGDPAAEKILEKFDDAVGMQRWHVAREISKIKNTSVLGDIRNWFKSGYNAVERFFMGGDDAPMSDDDIDKYRARMLKLIDMGNMQAKQALDRFNDAVMDGDWARARKISGLKYESLGARIKKWWEGTDENLSDDKQTSDTKLAQRYRLLFDRVKEAMQKPFLSRYKPLLAQLRNDMQSTDLLELDDELLDSWEYRLRAIDSSVGMTSEEDVAKYDEERKEKIKLVQQRDALLTEIAAAQERCPWSEFTRRSELKRLFREVSDLTMDELDQELLDSYDEELRIFDKDALTTKNLSEEERKRQAENYKRKEVLMNNIDQAIDRCGTLDFSKSNALRKLKGEVYSTLVEEMDDEQFDDWDQQLKDLDSQAHSSKQYSAEERKKMRELNNRRLLLVKMINESIGKTGVMFGRGNRAELQKLLKEVEAELDEDLTEEQIKDWEEQLKFLDDTAMSIDERQAFDKEQATLIREKRMLRRDLNLKSRKFLRGRTSAEKANGNALAKLVTQLDAVDDDKLTKEIIEDVKQRAAQYLPQPEAEPTQQQQGAQLSSGANEQAISLDKNGRIVDMQEGSPTSVSLKTKPGGQIIHTHPDGSPTSATDIAAAIANGQTSVTTLKSGKVLGYSGQTLPDILKETVKVQQQQAQNNTAEMHSVLKDIMTGVTDSVSGLDTRDVLTSIYDRLGQVIDAIEEHNGTMNNKIIASATQSYDLARNFTTRKLKQKVSSIASAFRPPVINISK